MRVLDALSAGAKLATCETTRMNINVSTIAMGLTENSIGPIKADQIST